MTVIWDMVHVVWRAKHHGVKEYLMAFPERDLAAAWMAEQPTEYQIITPSGMVYHAWWQTGIDTIPAQGFAGKEATS